MNLRHTPESDSKPETAPVPVGATRELVFAMTGAAGLCGGIASANLGVVQAFVRMSHDAGLPLRVLSLCEEIGDRPSLLPPHVPFEAFAGHRMAFVGRLVGLAGPRRLICIDHVHLAAPLLPAAAAGIARTVVFAHGSEAWKRIRRLSRWSFRHARLCVANSEFTLRKMRACMPGVRAVASPLGLSPAFNLEERIAPPSTAPVRLVAVDGTCRPLGSRALLLVARMHSGEREKGHRELLAVFPALLNRFPDAQLLFVGHGDDLPNLAVEAQARGVAASVFLPGRVSLHLLQDLYRRCYAFVMPSRQEGFGLAFLEGMNYGKACVGCLDQGSDDIIVHGRTGFLIRDPRDSTELFDILCRLLADSVLARELGAAGLAWLRTNFSAERYQDRLVSALTPLL